MQLTKKQIQSFKKLYKKYFQTELTEGEALELGIQLLNFIKQIILPNSEILGKK